MPQKPQQQLTNISLKKFVALSGEFWCLPLGLRGFAFGQQGFWDTNISVSDRVEGLDQYEALI